MTHVPRLLRTLAAALLAGAAASSAHAQYNIDWFTVDTGGGLSVNGDFTVEGTVGQFDAGKQVNSPDTELCGGYWNEITAFPTMTYHATVELAYVNTATFQRCITFQFFDANCPTPAATVDVVMTFTNRIASQAIQIPAGNYICATARDRRHTLRVTSDPGTFILFSGVYFADFTGVEALPGGNLNDDAYIDILDFGAFVGQFGVTYGSANTTCSTPPIHADISGDGTVNGLDYSFISTNFIMPRQPDCCAVARPGGAITDISLDDLLARGDWEIARTADLNRDWRLNSADIEFFAQHGLSGCAADYSLQGGLTVDDLFLFLDNWFRGHPATDIDANRSLTVDDLFIYLNAWFTGCP